jgi:hypothetical protein
MKVIAVDAAATTQGVIDVLERIQAEGPPDGWIFITFVSAVNLLARLTNDLPRGTIEKLEIVSEGTPEHLDAVELQPGEGRLGPARFGRRLKQVPGIERHTVVFLSGCNTGCSDPEGGIPIDRAIAQSIANRADVIVRGALGYISGTHAHRNPRCTPDDDQGFTPYEGAVPAPVKGEGCWREFRPV